MTTWTTTQQGTATGPTIIIETSSPADAVTLQALWSDEDGVVVNIHAEDVTLDYGLLDVLRDALLSLQVLTAPDVPDADPTHADTPGHTV